MQPRFPVGHPPENAAGDLPEAVKEGLNVEVLTFRAKGDV